MKKRLYGRIGETFSILGFLKPDEMCNVAKQDAIEMNQEIPKFHETFSPILEILSNREIVHTREMQKIVIERFYSHLPKELLGENHISKKEVTFIILQEVMCK